MILQGPAPVVFTPPVSQVRVRIVIDLDAGAITYVYSVPGGGDTKQVSEPIPAALLTALESRAKTVIEAAEGWANGSSTIVSP